MAHLTEKIKVDSKVLKHTATVHITDKLTLDSRKAYSFLLKNAFRDLLSKEEHEISIAELNKAMGVSREDADFRHRNYEHIKKAIISLASTTLEMNTLNKDKRKVWSCMSLLSEVKIEHGVCTYSFPKTIRESIKNPNIYARLDLAVMREIKSKKTLILWEYLIDVLCKGYSQTDWIEIEEIKKLYNIAEKPSYNEFKAFKREIINVALKEINSLNMDVKVEYKKLGRNVTHIKFIVEKANFQQSLPFIENVGFKGGVTVKRQKRFSSALISSLESLGISDKSIQELEKRYEEKRVEKNLKLLLDKLQESSVIRDKISYFFKSVQEDFASNNKEKDINNNKEFSKTLIKIRKQIEKQQNTIEKNQRHLSDKIYNYCEEVFSGYSEEKKEKIKSLVKEKYFQGTNHKLNKNIVNKMVSSVVKDSLSNTTEKELKDTYEQENKFSFKEAEKKLEKFKEDLSIHTQEVH